MEQQYSHTLLGAITLFIAGGSPMGGVHVLRASEGTTLLTSPLTKYHPPPTHMAMLPWTKAMESLAPRAGSSSLPAPFEHAGPP